MTDRTYHQRVVTDTEMLVAPASKGTAKRMPRRANELLSSRKYKKLVSKDIVAKIVDRPSRITTRLPAKAALHKTPATCITPAITLEAPAKHNARSIEQSAFSIQETKKAAIEQPIFAHPSSTASLTPPTCCVTSRVIPITDNEASPTSTHPTFMANSSSTAKRQAKEVDRQGMGLVSGPFKAKQHKGQLNPSSLTSVRQQARLKPAAQANKANKAGGSKHEVGNPNLPEATPRPSSPPTTTKRQPTAVQARALKPATISTVTPSSTPTPLVQRPIARVEQPQALATATCQVKKAAPTTAMDLDATDRLRTMSTAIQSRFESLGQDSDDEEELPEINFGCRVPERGVPVTSASSYSPMPEVQTESTVDSNKRVHLTQVTAMSVKTDICKTDAQTASLSHRPHITHIIDDDDDEDDVIVW
eukprot:m.20668 g.20668  ORF g.20668 m.20668 type:complete len:419 (-) comp11038_c0_seq4:35-1291(-)